MITRGETPTSRHASPSFVSPGHALSPSSPSGGPGGRPSDVFSNSKVAGARRGQRGARAPHILRPGAGRRAMCGRGAKKVWRVERGNERGRGGE
jgi:hypothetical protein